MYELTIEAGQIASFRRAVQAVSNEHSELTIMPPTFLTTAMLGHEDIPSMVGIDPRRMLHGEEEYEYVGPMPHAGETLTVRTTIGDAFEKIGSRGGVMRFVKVGHTFCRLDGAVAVEQWTTLIETDAAPNSSGGTRPPTLNALPGEPGPVRYFGPITRTDIIRYVGASGDFNPVHHDDDFARATGFPQIFAPGMFQAGLLATYAADWLGASAIRRFGVRFRDQVWPGDKLRCEGAISSREETTEGEQIEVGLRCTRQTGHVVLVGFASFVHAG